jgi:hypothetical protein
MDQHQSRRWETMWLYDPSAEEFRRAPRGAEEPWLASTSRGQGRYRHRVPRTRWGRLLYHLFLMGWICPVLLSGIMAFALIAWVSGSH